MDSSVLVPTGPSEDGIVSSLFFFIGCFQPLKAKFSLSPHQKANLRLLHVSLSTMRYVWRCGHSFQTSFTSENLPSQIKCHLLPGAFPDTQSRKQWEKQTIVSSFTQQVYLQLLSWTGLCASAWAACEGVSSPHCADVLLDNSPWDKKGLLLTPYPSNTAFPAVGIKSTLEKLFSQLLFACVPALAGEWVLRY